MSRCVLFWEGRREGGREGRRERERAREGEKEGGGGLEKGGRMEGREKTCPNSDADFPPNLAPARCVSRSLLSVSVFLFWVFNRSLLGVK